MQLTVHTARTLVRTRYFIRRLEVLFYHLPVEKVLLIDFLL